MVALVPGRMTQFATGIGSPGRTNTSRTDGSSRKGSKSSKLAMRESVGTAMVTWASSRGLKAVRPNASSAGRRTASGKNGARPKARQPVRSAIIRMPSANRLASPRNLLTTKPAIVAASPGSSAAFVPRTWANTPPRSMSATSTTGTAGRAGEAHVGDVALAQVDLRGAAGAFDQHEVRLRLQAREAVEHGVEQLRLRAS